MRRLPVTLAAIGLVAGAASACSDDPSPDGTVRGQYLITGGLDSAAYRTGEGTIWIWAGRVSRDQASTTTPAKHLITATDGRYSISLAPGTYTIWASPSRAGLIEAPACGSPVAVVIRAGRGTTADVRCSVL